MHRKLRLKIAKTCKNRIAKKRFFSGVFQKTEISTSKIRFLRSNIVICVKNLDESLKKDLQSELLKEGKYPLTKGHMLVSELTIDNLTRNK